MRLHDRILNDRIRRRGAGLKRTRVGALAAAVITVGMFAPFASAQPGEERFAGPRPQVQWVSSLGEALSISGREDKPVLIFMTMDGERANDFMTAETYRRSDILALAEHVAPIVTNVTVHAATPDDPCPKYDGITCRDHVAAEAAVVSTFFASGQNITVPHHIFLDATGRPIVRREFLIDGATLANLMMRAIRIVNPERARAAATSLESKLVAGLASDRQDERNEALTTVLDRCDGGDEIARTLLFEVDPAQLTPDQERAVLERCVAEPDAAFASDVARLVRGGSETLRAESIRRLAERIGDERFGRHAVTTLVRTLAAAPDAALRTSIENALGVSRDNGSLRFADSIRSSRFAIARALARHGDPAALDLLAATIESTASPEQRTDAALAMLDYPSYRVVPILARGLASGGADRAVLARVLGELGDPAAAPALMRALENQSPALRASAATALGMLKYEEAIAPLTTMARDASLDGSVRVAAAAALVELGSQEGAVDVLIEFADDPFHDAAARHALQRAHAGSVPESASDWRAWWDEQRGE